MAAKLGKDAVLGRNNGGSYGTPVWDTIPNVTDLSYPLTKEEADVTTRGYGGWVARLGTLKDTELSFDMVYDSADADMLALQDSYINGTQIDFLVCDGPITTGNKGLRFYGEVFNFEKSEELRDAQRVSVTIKPAYNAQAPVYPYTVP